MQTNKHNTQTIYRHNNDRCVTNHTICQAFALGKPVQYRDISFDNSAWQDFNRESVQCEYVYFGPWVYEEKLYEWRIKPETLKGSYKVALFKDGSVLAVKYHDHIRMRGVEENNAFVSWITEVVDFEVEVKD
jgi:hypothetical protein